MRRSIGYLAAWAVVTTVAVGLSWLGIRSAMEPAPVAVVEATGGPGVLPLPTMTSISVPVPASEPVPTSAGVPTATTTTTRPPLRSSAPVTTVPSSSTDGRGGVAQLPGGEWQPDGSYVHAFHLRGGDVVVRYRVSGVEALSATPAEGWAVGVEQPGGPLVVNFRDAAGRLSRLEATWNGGPTARVIER